MSTTGAKNDMVIINRNFWVFTCLRKRRYLEPFSAVVLIIFVILDAILHGYDSVNHLTDEEKQAIYYF